MPGTAPSTSASIIASKFQDISEKHNAHLENVTQLGEIAADEVLPTVLQSVGLDDDPEAAESVRRFLSDRGV